MAQVSTTRVENLGRNLRALIQELVVETRKNSFKQNDPATQNLLKRFASQAHTYQIAAKNAGKNLTKAAAMENIRGNAKKAVENAAAAAAAANVSAAAGSAAAAVKVNATPSALRALLNKAAAAIKNLTTRKPAASNNPPHITFNKAENYFKTQPNSNSVAANKQKAGAKKRLLGGWNYGVNNSRTATFWKGYNVLDKNLQNMARTRNFTRYIPLGRNANKNIKKYPKYTQFFTNVKNLPVLNTRRNALLAQEVGPLQVNAFGQSVDELLKQYNRYKGYEPVTKSYAQLAQHKGSVKGTYMSSANRTVFKGFANKGPAEYRLAKRNAVSNRKAYGTDPEFKKFWNAYNKSDAALKLETAKAAAVSAANMASYANISVLMATTAARDAAAAAAEARAHFNKTNRSTVLKSVRDAANSASKRAQASLAAAKKREAEAAAKVANAQKAAAAAKVAATKAAANKAAKITKVKNNISKARNATNKARQAVNASKAAAEAAKAQTLRAQLNNLGADQEAKSVANQQVQEARGHANAAKKAAAQKTFDAELAQFIRVKSYAKPESLAAILSRMNDLAPIAGIATNNARLTKAREDQHKVAIKFFIQEVWPKTARGGAPGNANVNRIARSYGLTYPLSPEDKNIMRSLIPNNANKNSIIGWKRLERRPDGNYISRRDALRQVLFGSPAATAPAPMPIPGSRGAKLLEPNKRARPQLWTINAEFTNAYAMNNQRNRNLYIKKQNGTYRKVNNPSTGNFTNANVYTWNAAVKNFNKK